MQKNTKVEKIEVHPPKIKPKVNNIGHGNPRYNSMLVYKNNLLLPVGCTLRHVNLEKQEILFNKQIGYSQIFNIGENSKYVMVVNFEGLVSLLDKEDLEIKHQFYTAGKQIRHSCITEDYIAVVCELTDVEFRSKLQIFKMENVESKKYEAQVTITGDYYYPEIINGQLIVVEHDDPNPKGRARADTVLWKKLPVKHRIVKFDKEFKPAETFDLKFQGDITCAVLNPVKPTIFYLHNGNKLTAFNPITNQVISHQNDKKDKGMPLCLEKYKDGVVYAAGPNKLGYLYQEGDQLKREEVEVVSKGVGHNLSIKTADHGFYLFNDSGLHYYSFKQNKDYTSTTFHITNCGLSFSPDGNHYAIADFGGNVYMLETNSKSMIPQPREVVSVGIPVRSLVWCRTADRIVIGCVDGSLFDWKELLPVVKPIQNLKHAVNVLRSANGYLYAGTSDGNIHIYNEKTLEKIYSFQAHAPVQHESQKARQLFGSLENYAQIWSLAVSPVHRDPMVIVSSSEDQSQKVHMVQQCKQELLHRLSGHELAVTSIDWKVMGKDLGQIYASCSDDKIVRIRNPEKDFEVMFEIQTSTIKQWHTLTYLALQPNGHRVAFGTQNGYLFIYDIAARELLFGEKVHLGGVQGLDWRKNKICTISSDLCVSILEIQ